MEKIRIDTKVSNGNYAYGQKHNYDTFFEEIDIVIEIDEVNNVL